MEERPISKKQEEILNYIKNEILSVDFRLQSVRSARQSD